MKKTKDETMLSAYIDGELDAATMHEVDLFIEKDEEAAKGKAGEKDPNATPEAAPPPTPESASPSDES